MKMKTSTRLLLCICVIFSFAGCQKPNYDIPREWTPVYNEHRCGLMVNPCLSDLRTEEMTQEEIAKILPLKTLPIDVYKAYAMFEKSGKVYMVVLHIGSPEKYMSVSLGPGSYYSGCCVSFESDAEKSVCGDVDYRLYIDNDNVIAKTTINNIDMLARTSGKQTLEKQVFEAVLECFSWYAKGKPELKSIK